MEGQLRELRERAAASTAALRSLAAQGEEVEAFVQRKRTLKPLVVELRSEVCACSLSVSFLTVTVHLFETLETSNVPVHPLQIHEFPGGDIVSTAQRLEHCRTTRGGKRARARYSSSKHAKGTGAHSRHCWLEDVC